MKVISGLQTGIDEQALAVAHLVGLETGGTCPRDYIQEGNHISFHVAELYKVVPITFEQIEEYKQKYPCPWGEYSTTQLIYLPRTWMNVVNSDASVYFNFGETDSRGFQATRRIAKVEKKPFWVFEQDFSTAEDLYKKIKQKDVNILNIAGNRLSSLKSPEAYDWLWKKVIPLLIDTLRRFRAVKI